MITKEFKKKLLSGKFSLITEGQKQYVKVDLDCIKLIFERFKKGSISVGVMYIYEGEIVGKMDKVFNIREGDTISFNFGDDDIKIPWKIDIS